MLYLDSRYLDITLQLHFKQPFILTIAAYKLFLTVSLEHVYSYVTPLGRW